MSENLVRLKSIQESHLEYLALGGAQHDDAAELGERDAGQHGRAHARERVGGAQHARAAARHAERVHHVRAELHRDAHGHHLRNIARAQ